MEIIVHIPDEALAELPCDGGDLSRELLEAYALEHYKTGELTTHQVQELLGLETRMDVDAFLKRHGVPGEMTIEELDEQRRAFHKLLAK